MSETTELTADDFARSLKRSQRKRIVSGRLESGDVVALRRFVTAPCFRSSFARTWHPQPELEKLRELT